MPHPFAISVSIRAVDEVTQTLNRVVAPNNISRNKNGAAVSDFNKKLESIGGTRTLASATSALKGEIQGIFSSIESNSFFTGIESGANRAVKSFQILGGAAKRSLNVLTGASFAIGGLVLRHQRFSKMSPNLTSP